MDVRVCAVPGCSREVDVRGARCLFCQRSARALWGEGRAGWEAMARAVIFWALLGTVAYLVFLVGYCCVLAARILFS